MACAVVLSGTQNRTLVVGCSCQTSFNFFVALALAVVGRNAVWLQRQVLESRVRDFVFEETCWRLNRDKIFSLFFRRLRREGAKKAPM